MGTLIEHRRRLMAEKTFFVPPEYQQVPYIMAPGDQAIIDTGVPGNNDNLKFQFAYNCDRQTNYRGLFTNYESETANCWRFSLSTISGSYIYTANSKTGSSGVITIVGSIGKDTVVVLDKSSITVTANGITGTLESPTAEGTANSNNIFINSSRTYSRTNNDETKWYYFRIWDNGVLIRWYVPVFRKSDNKVGFYDTVHKTFCPSTGTKELYLPTA